MGLEIERKFLVKKTWTPSGNGILIKQGYLSTDPDMAVRIRIAGKNATLTLKQQVSDLTRQEFEFPIPRDEAEKVLKSMCRKPILEKTRYLVEFHGFTWEVDVFSGENEGLEVAEIELESETQDFARPGWVLEEVTGDPRYLNINLIDFPFKKWKTGN